MNVIDAGNRDRARAKVHTPEYGDGLDVGRARAIGARKQNVAAGQLTREDLEGKRVALSIGVMSRREHPRNIVVIDPDHFADDLRVPVETAGRRSTRGRGG